MQIARLPYVDEHATAIAAGVDEVWRALVKTLDDLGSETAIAVFAMRRESR
jgi:hypothetical protein